MRNSKTDHRSQFIGAANAAREDVVEMGNAAKGIARDQVARLADEMALLRDKVVDRIEAKPVKSLFIALGAGLLLGLVVGRR